MFLVGCCNKPDQQDKYILTEFAFVYTKYIYIHTHTHVRIQKHTDTKSKSMFTFASLCKTQGPLRNDVYLGTNPAGAEHQPDEGLQALLASGPLQRIFR